MGGIVAVCAAVFAFIFFSRKAGSKTDTADVSPACLCPRLQAPCVLAICLASDSLSQDHRPLPLAFDHSFQVEVVPELDLDLSSTPCVAKDMAGMVKDMAEKSHGISIKKTTENYEPEDLVIVELLATSGNSRVYKALWRGATVAQKRIELPNNPTTFQKKQSSMAMEAAISASMSHPNVVQTYSCEIVPIKRSFLAKVTAINMSWCDGMHFSERQSL